ncbi:hypothetical protein Tco_1516733 [Tanacetum coccineum]
MATTRQTISSTAIELLISQRVAGALTAYEANRNSGGIDVACQTPWKDLNKMMTEEYCHRNELQNIEVKFLNFVIRMAYDLMDQVMRAKAAKNVNNRRKWEDNHSGNVGHQQNKRHEVKRKLHHNGPCTDICRNCKKVGHQTRDYGTPAPETNQRISVTCFECGMKGDYKSECSKLKNQNERRAHERAFMLG